MATTAQAPSGSAAKQGELWGARAGDWATLQEPLHRGLYLPVLDAAGVGEGTRLLDVGCGSGVAAQVALERGARINGLEAAAASVDEARRRVPDAEFVVGEMEELPYADDTFDVVTGFNSFQYATDPVHALREARRVTRPGGKVAVLSWGRAEACEMSSVLKALGTFLPPPPPGAPGPFALAAPGALEELAAKAGLTPLAADEFPTTWTYPDVETALRALTASGPAIAAIRTAGDENAVRNAITNAITPYRTGSGAYALENSWRYLIAAA